MTENPRSERKQIISRVAQADALLIGASNGLSITEGLHLLLTIRLLKNYLGI